MSAPVIMVIDDSLADVQLLRLALDREEEPYILELLTDGGAALDFVREHREMLRLPEPCVIVLDANLPRHSGLEVLQAIRQSPALTHIRIVVVSGIVHHHLVAEATRANAICREKPTNLDAYMELGAEIFELCRGSHRVAR